MGKIRNFEELVESFKVRISGTLRSNRNKIIASGISAEVADGAIEKFEESWQENWEPGGEYYVSEHIMEDTKAVRKDGSTVGPATISPMDVLMVSPVIVSALLDVIKERGTPETPLGKAQVNALMEMIRLLINSRGQFAVWRMSFNIDSPSEHHWVVIYGNFLGLNSEQSGTVGSLIRHVQNHGLAAREIEMEVGFLYWDLISPFIEDGLVIPLCRLQQSV